MATVGVKGLSRVAGSCASDIRDYAPIKVNYPSVLHCKDNTLLLSASQSGLFFLCVWFYYLTIRHRKRTVHYIPYMQRLLENLSQMTSEREISEHFQFIAIADTSETIGV